MPRFRRRFGQSSVEYLLLMCSILFVVSYVGMALKNLTPQITERLIGSILSTAWALATL